jgi:hypothetical protein
MFPVPTEARIDLAIIAGGSPKVEDQTAKEKDFKEQKDNSQFHPERSHPWEFKNRSETNDGPHRQKENQGSPPKYGF